MRTFNSFMGSNTGKDKNRSMAITNQAQSATGFMYADYMNGANVIIYDENEMPIKRFHNTGLLNGSLNTLIAKSNVGKTTLALGFARGIIEPWIKDPILRRYINPELNPKFDYNKASLIQIDDSEKTLDLSNVKRITQYPNSLLKNNVVINQVSTDKDLVKSVEDHVKFKTSTMQKLYLPSCDIYGDHVYSYPTTVLIIDSLNKITPHDVEGLDDKVYDKATSNTAGARRARIISSILSSLVNYAKMYNIVILLIGHINIAPNMTGMPQAKQYHGLKVGETLSGGERSIYLASNIGRMDRIKDIGGEKSSAINFGEGIEGSITRYSNIKSKTNKFNANCHLVYLNSVGYDPLYSTMYEAMQNGDIQKVGNFYSLDRRPEVKLSIKNFKEKFAEDITLMYDFYDQISHKAERLLSGGMSEKKYDKELLDGAKNEFNGAPRDVVQELDEIYAEIYNTKHGLVKPSHSAIEKANRRILDNRMRWS